MAEKKKSFLEKNFPTLYKKKEAPSGKGRGLSISETTKEARTLRGEEKKKKNKGIEVKEVTELKGYKPTVLKLPTANLLPYESKLRAEKRNLRLLFLIIIIGVIGISFSSRFFFDAQNSNLKTEFDASENAIQAQEEVNNRYQPLQTYLNQISERNRVSEEVNKTLPPWTQILTSIEGATLNTGVTLSSYSVSSKVGTSVESDNSGSASSGGALEGECGPLNNPFEKNEAPTLGCLQVSIIGSTEQAVAYEDFLRQFPIFTELYTSGNTNTQQQTTTSSSRSSREDVETPQGTSYVITAAIISPPEPSADTTSEGGEQ